MTEQNILDALRKHAVCHLPKWPQMIVTGKRVTVDQAKEIIFRTDSFLSDASDYSGGNARNFNRNYRTKAGLDLLSVERKYPEGHTYRDVDWEKQETLREALEFIHTEYVTNNWGSCAFIFGPHGWCHPDGTILYSDNIGKWPELESVYDDWAKIAEAFPFLDLNVTLMNKESCEDDSIPVINFRVANGKVTVEPPDLSVHCDPPLRDFEEDFDDLSLPPEYRELGLPLVWYDDFSERVATEVKKLVE